MPQYWYHGVPPYAAGLTGGKLQRLSTKLYRAAVSPPPRHTPTPKSGMAQPMTAHLPSNQWTLSLIVPVLNEADSVRRFLDETLEVLLPIVPAVEVIFIDDGSTDGTLEILRGLSSTYPAVRYVSFSRNFGKEAALSAGLEYATGDAVVPMDADLRHPPEAVVDFIDVWRHRGVEVVYGIPASKQAETASKTATSSWFCRKAPIWGIDTPGYASLIPPILFFAGMQLLSIGILGEYVERIFPETKRRPLYVVMEGGST